MHAASVCAAGKCVYMYICMYVSCTCKTINRSHAHRTHRQRKHPRHRHTHAHDKTPKRTPPTSTQQRSTVARRRCVPPPTPGWVAAPQDTARLAANIGLTRMYHVHSKMPGGEPDLLPN